MPHLTRRFLLMFALLWAMAQPAQAQLYVGLEASATRLSEPSWRGRGAGVILGYVAGDRTAYELGWRRLGTDLVVDQRQAGSLWEATGLWRMPLSASYNAYGRAGIAQLGGELADTGRNGARLRPLFGIGLHVVLFDDWALRAEAQRVGSGLTGLRLGVVHRF